MSTPFTPTEECMAVKRADTYEVPDAKRVLRDNVITPVKSQPVDTPSPESSAPIDPPALETPETSQSIPVGTQPAESVSAAELTSPIAMNAREKKEAEALRLKAEKLAEKERKKAEKLAEKERKEIERLAEKEKKEAERLAEKEKKEAEKRAEKERKEAEKLAEKERKEAEKERKEAEKIAEKERKEAEKRAEKEKKEAEKQAEKDKKDAEKQAEKDKLLKAQPRILSFFKTQPAAFPSNHQASNVITGDPMSSPIKPAASPSTQLVSDSLDTVGLQIPELEMHDRGDTVEPESDYRKHILPFHLKQGGQLFSSVCNARYSAEEQTMDPLEWLKAQSAAGPAALPPQGNTITSQAFQKELVAAHDSAQLANLLTRLRVRRLQFSHLSAKYEMDPTVPINEEFRPPYTGSTPDISHVGALALNPFRTDLDPAQNYEYDSEVEWVDEDGDDLREDDEESDEELDDPDDLNEFLSSDEDESSSNKPRIVGQLHPVIMWGAEHDLSSYAVQLMDQLSLIEVEPVIDTEALKEEPKEEPKEAKEALTEAKDETPKDETATTTMTTSSTEPAESISTLCSKLDHEALKTSLVSHIGSSATKTLIVELLKQQFTGQATAGEIKKLFDLTLERQGKKRNEKVWVLTSQAKAYFDLPA